MSTPSFKEMLETWNAVTKAADPFLDTLTTVTLQDDLLLNGESVGQIIGSALRRVTYHYWYHVGEIQAIRQMLGHRDLAAYAGDTPALARRCTPALVRLKPHGARECRNRSSLPPGVSGREFR